MKFLTEPELLNIDINSAQRFDVHRKILERKNQTLAIFKEIQNTMVHLVRRFCLAQVGQEIELGAGVYPLKENFKNVLATDVVAGPLIDKVLNAQYMDLPNNSVKALYAQNCLHHFPDPELFFQQCERVLAPGGVVIIIDPSHTLLSRLIYPILFASEDYNTQAPSWKTSDQGAMKGANQALSYIIFQRDRKIFNTLFPNLEIVHEDILGNSLRYLLSGGLNFKSLLPGFLFPLLQMIESLMRPLRCVLGLHHVYVLRKRPTLQN